MFRTLLTGALLACLVEGAMAQSSTGPLAVEDRRVASSGKDAQRREAPSDEALMLLMQQLQQYEQEMQNLRDMVESLRHEVDTMKEAQRARYLDLDSRINALAEASLNQAVEESGGGEGQATGNADDSQAYKAAREKLLNRDFQAARDAFRAYLDQYPEGEFRPFAHFWLGEVLRSLPDGDTQKAAEHFRTVIEQYPEHSKVPAALYKLASIQAERNNVAQARVTLNKILLQYPDSSEAKLARTMLMQLEGGKTSS